MGDSDTVTQVRDPLGLEGGNGFMGKHPPQPGQPDYIGAANAQSYGTIGAAIANNLMSHPNINTPLGSQTWNQTGTADVNIPGLGNVSLPQYSQTVQMSPEQQKLYNQQTGISSGLLGATNENLSKPQDFSGVQGVADKAYGAMTARLDPQWAQREQMQKTQLANQGLTAGGEAYDNAMRDFNQGRNDAYQQANLGAIQTMPQTLQMANTIRDQPLNELNAFRSGSQVNMPQFQPSQYPGTASGPNTLGATQQQASWQQAMFNQQQANQNAQNQGLMGLGAAMFF